MFAVVFLFFAHPFLLGLDGRIGEYRFRRDLRVGMSRSKSVALARHLGAPSWGIGLGADSALVQFVDFSTPLCESSGKSFELSFDNRSRLLNWTVADWTTAC
jgi:hypothetical protein